MQSIFQCIQIQHFKILKTEDRLDARTLRISVPAYGLLPTLGLFEMNYDYQLIFSSLTYSEQKCAFPYYETAEKDLVVSLRTFHSAHPLNKSIITNEKLAKRWK